jgi:hypothetical protein
VLPSRNNIPGYFTAVVTAVIAGIAGLIAFRRRGETTAAPSPRAGEGRGGGSEVIAEEDLRENNVRVLRAYPKTSQLGVSC